MPDNQLGEAWRVRERSVPVSTVLNFTADGLVLGAGTVLIRTEGPRRLRGLAGREAQVLALLSAAYGRAIAPSVLGNIARAAKAWNQGDDCLAYVHLAHARLGELQYARDAAQRLMMVDGFLKAGGSPRTIFEALKVGRSYVDALEKDYNPAEPRVPPGSGKPSGEWTKGDVSGGEPASAEQTANAASSTNSPLSYSAPGPSWLAGLKPAAAASLGEFAASVVVGAAGAAAVFGLIFIPSPNNIHVEGEVAGIPGLRYSWNRDETVLHLTYGDPNGAQRTLALHVDGDVVRDDDGKVVGHVIGGNKIAIDTVAVLPDVVKQNEPRLCPAPAPDVAGSDQGKPYEENRARQYEDFVKSLINPPPKGPTPSGYVYYLPDPKSGEPVSYDDCEQPSGTILFEIKGKRIAILANDLPAVMTADFVGQATRQVAASGGRPIVWIFAEEDAARFARKLFNETPGLEGITVVYIPWTRSGR